MFISKTNKVYSWNEIASTNILNNSDLLSNYSLKELDDIYKSNKLGNFEFLYKDILLKLSILFDQSDKVNSFIYKNNKYWLDKLQRSCMKTVAESDLDFVEIVMGDVSAVVSAEFVKLFILQLEAYAYKCYVNTAKHQQAINKLTTIQDALNYDFTTGYPEKLILE